MIGYIGCGPGGAEAAGPRPGSEDKILIYTVIIVALVIAGILLFAEPEPEKQKKVEKTEQTTPTAH